MENITIYSVNGISYRYSEKFSALKGVNLDIEKGERIALLGANGSGKSTLLLALAGLIFPAEGSIKFSGKSLTEENLLNNLFRADFRSRVGIIFQNPDIQLFNSNVRDELAFGLLQLGLPDNEINNRIDKYMALMDIAKLSRRHPQNLSVGEKKRVAIASVLAMEPEIMLLDEPTAGLDPRTSRHLIDAIAGFGHAARTIVTATQDIHIVAEIADRIVVMGEDKTVVRDGKADDILKDTGFLEEHNLVHSHAHRHKTEMHVHPHEHPDHGHEHGECL